MSKTTTEEHKMSASETSWAQREQVGYDLMDALQTAEQNENDAEVARIAAKLEALGYDVEWTGSGYMVSR